MKIIKSILFTLLVLSVIPSAYSADNVESLVREYLKLDYDGARIVGGDLKAIESLLDNSALAYWDIYKATYLDYPKRIKVIGKYEFKSIKQKNGQECAEVNFHVLGYLTFYAYFSKIGYDEQKKFKGSHREMSECLYFTKVGNELKIKTDSLYHPHVSFETTERVMQIIHDDDLKHLKSDMETYNNNDYIIKQRRD